MKVLPHRHLDVLPHREGGEERALLEQNAGAALDLGGFLGLIGPGGGLLSGGLLGLLGPGGAEDVAVEATDAPPAA